MDHEEEYAYGKILLHIIAVLNSDIFLRLEFCSSGRGDLNFETIAEHKISNITRDTWMFWGKCPFPELPPEFITRIEKRPLKNCFKQRFLISTIVFYSLNKICPILLLN